VAERFGGSRRVVDRESDYSKRRFNRTLSPTRDEGTTTYAERVREAQLDRERDNTMRQIAQKQREEAEKAAGEARLAAKTAKESAVRAMVTGEPSQRDRDVSLSGLGPPETKKRDRGVTETWDDDAGKRAKTEGEWEDQPPSAPAAERNPRGGATDGTRRPRTSPRAAAPAAARAVAGTRRRGTCPWTRRPCISARARRRR